MEKENKELKALIDKIMSNEHLEKPSLDFTDNIMSKVEVVSKSAPIVYKPLIPTYVWVAIIGAFLLLVSYVYFKEPATSNVWLDRFNLIKNTKNPLGTLTLNFSKILTYAVVLFAVMLSIQIPLLKQYFNKRMAV